MSEPLIIETSVGPCRLKRSNRKTLAISVLPDGSVELVAPEDTSENDVVQKVKRKARWIGRQRRLFAEMNGSRPPLKYRSGSTHRYLGRQYRLKVQKGQKPGVKLRGAFFHITTTNESEERVKELLLKWMRDHAHEKFGRRLEKWKDWCIKRKLPKPMLRLRSMPKRWGSAHRDGRIFLNPELVRAPSLCIDYVIAHEVCHLQHPSHDKAFYRLLSELFPDWQTVKLKLEQVELS